jgi:integrase
MLRLVGTDADRATPDIHVRGDAAERLAEAVVTIGRILLALAEPARQSDGVTSASANLGVGARSCSIVDDVLAWEAAGLSRGLDARYLRQGRSRLLEAIEASGWTRIDEVSTRGIEEWLAGRTKSGTTYNRLLGYWTAFLEWARRTERVRENAARRILKARELGGGVTTRAFTVAEATAIIEWARRDGADPKSKRKARDRWIVYLTAWHTGLRRGELRKITVSMLSLRDSPPRILLSAKVAKARKAQTVPLHPDLIEPLRKLAEGKRPHDILFPFVRDELVAQDIELAGVQKIVDGLTCGLHSFRKGLATELARSGVVEGVAQALLRHSDPRLTRNVYTDARLLPLAEAVSAVASITGSSYAQSPHEGPERFDTRGGMVDTRAVTSVTPPSCSGPCWALGAQPKSLLQGLESLALSAAPPRSLPTQGSRGDQECRRQESKLPPAAVSRVLTAAAELLASCADVLAGSSSGVGNVQPLPPAPSTQVR